MKNQTSQQQSVKYTVNPTKIKTTVKSNVWNETTREIELTIYKSERDEKGKRKPIEVLKVNSEYTQNT